MDTMVMDNDEAQQRHGVEPTYQKVKGFQPLQLTWGRLIIDAVFRGGSKHRNHRDTALKMVSHIVKLIRKHCGAEIPIIIRLDTGFIDQKLLPAFPAPGLGVICSGNIYNDIDRLADMVPKSPWRREQNRRQAWEYLDCGNRRGNWHTFWRAILCRPVASGKQRLLDFARPLTSYYYLRRQVIDIAAQMVRGSGQVILKVTEANMAQWQFAGLWAGSNTPPQFVWA